MSPSFEQPIGSIRQQGGNRAAADLKEQLLPAKLQTEILMKSGYCGLAKHLRAKRLIKFPQSASSASGQPAA